ncbi:hypothetical protein NMG60_11021566 [Bertholletia excelsa]
MLLLTLFLSFLVGALTIIAIEVAGVVFVIGRLNNKIKQGAKVLSESARVVSDLDPSPDCSFYDNKQGVVWVLEPEKVPESFHRDQVPREQKRKKEIFEVSPVRKHAKLKNQSLILTESDNSHAKIQLKGCNVVAVSATTLPSRKWAKKYPIKVESKSVIYHGSKTVFIYFETCSEKESWCKALRYASCVNKEKLEWFSQLNLEFHGYLTMLSSGHPSFMKPSGGVSAESVERSVKLDAPPSRVRHFLKKLAKKASKSGLESKMSWPSTSGHEERKFSEKCQSIKESSLSTNMNKTASTRKPNSSSEDTISSSSLSHSDSKSHISLYSDVDSDDKIGSDEGTLCWNMLISRLFFDAKSNMKMKSLIQSRIQRTLYGTRTPSYIGEIICKGIDLGNLPPHINSMKVLPSDMNEVWALEIDIQYSGGAVLDIETRIEVHELELQEGKVDANLESSSVGVVTSDLLEGFEDFERKLELSEGNVDAMEQKEQEDSKPDGMKSYKSNSRTSFSGSRWRSILNSIARRVSQVPLLLAVKVTSLRGTLRLYIKPPPSDQLWFGFTSMPDVDFNLESSIGEHKINSGHIALFLISRFKAAIRETLVLPNCESVCIPWMLAEKDDWVPRNVAPFLWIRSNDNQEAFVDHPNANVVHDISSSSSQPCPGELTLRPPPKTESSSRERETAGASPEKTKEDCFQRINSSEPSFCGVGVKRYLSDTESPPTSQRERSDILQDQELSTPLLSKGCDDEVQVMTCEGSCRSKESEAKLMNQIMEPSGKESEAKSTKQIMETSMDNDDIMIGSHRTKRERMGTRARMLGLGKKMGEKLEEKRRHFEEKGRNIVERMKGPSSSPSIGLTEH